MSEFGKADRSPTTKAAARFGDRIERQGVAGRDDAITPTKRRLGFDCR
jgi:hypothetical protein